MFLPEPPHSEAVEAAYAEDLEHDGYVFNNTRLWSYRPDVSERFVELRALLTSGSGLSEREVAVLIARGLTNDETARSLHISHHTVATHIKRMYERLGFGSRVELTRYVIDHRLDED